MVEAFSRYRVHFYDRKSVYHTIQHLSFLEEYIKDHGIAPIRKIIFEFNPLPYFIHSYHNISLCNTGNHSFTIQFYHFYNSRNELNVLSSTIQYQDYYKLIYLLYHRPLLNTLLVPYIHPPFSNDLNE
jgi:hypothetical protein